jgi:hypothetical protein
LKPRRFALTPLDPAKSPVPVPLTAVEATISESVGKYCANAPAEASPIKHIKDSFFIRFLTKREATTLHEP